MLSLAHKILQGATKKMLLLLVFAYLYIAAHASQSKSSPSPSTATTNKVDQQIHQASKLMTEERYDSAYNLVSNALALSDTTSYTLGKYYLYAFQSEILYYNSLFSPALHSAFTALRFAEDLRNDTLIGSIENLIGLLYANLHQYEDAAIHLRNAISKIPLKHDNDYLSYRFHACSNLSEVFLETGKIDSSLKYTKLSLDEAIDLGRIRAVAINYWNYAKANLISGNFESARTYIDTGTSIAIRNNLNDVQMFFQSLEAELYFAEKQKAKCLLSIQSGLDKIKNEKSLTAFSKIDYLNVAIRLLIDLDEYILTSKAQVLLSELKTKTDLARNKEQINILERFYENEKKTRTI